MYNSKIFKEPDLDFRWFYDEVIKFNAIANPDGVDEENQLKLIEEEIQEILESKSEEEFLDGIIDALFVLAPLSYREDYILDKARELHHSNFLTTLSSNTALYSIQNVYILLQALHAYGIFGISSAASVVESNLSKFIPVEDYEERYLEEVKASYPDVDVNLVKRSYEGKDYYVFLNRKTGKVLKGHSHYKEPNIITGD